MPARSLFTFVKVVFKEETVVPTLASLNSEVNLAKSLLVFLKFSRIVLMFLSLSETVLFIVYANFL